MPGLKLPQAMVPQKNPNVPQQKPMLNVSQMNIPAMLSKQLNIPPKAVMQLMQMLKQAKNPQQAVMMIKSFDRNPQTMNEQFNPQQMQQPQAAQPAQPPAPAAGLQLGK